MELRFEDGTGKMYYMASVEALDGVQIRVTLGAGSELQYRYRRNAPRLPFHFHHFIKLHIGSYL